jgi:hypothetical protein
MSRADAGRYVPPMSAVQTGRAIIVALIVSFLLSAAAATVMTGQLEWPRHFTIVDQTSATGFVDAP